jgi:hypothetical protein
MQEAGFACYPKLEPNSKSMMKTKLTLFVTVLAAALFVVGCASTPKYRPLGKALKSGEFFAEGGTYHLGNLKEENGLLHHKVHFEIPITGRVVKMLGGELRTEFFVKKGIKHGPYRKWHTQNDKVMAGYKYKDSVYENGVLVKHKEFAHTYRDDVFKDSKELQIEIPGWNKDGSPKK